MASTGGPATTDQTWPGLAIKSTGDVVTGCETIRDCRQSGAIRRQSHVLPLNLPRQARHSDAAFPGGKIVFKAPRYQDLKKLVIQAARGRSMGSYLIALLAVLFAAAIRFGLEPWLAGRAHYLVFVVAVFIAAMFGGSIPAALAAILSVLCVELLDEAYGRVPSATVELATFLGSAAIVIWLVHLIMQLRRRSAQDEGQARLREEHAIQQAEAHALLIDGLGGHGLAMLDVDGRVRIWSKGAERLLGWTEEDAVGQLASFCYPASDLMAGKPAADLDGARIDGGISERTARLHKNGSTVIVEIDFCALHDPRGRFRGYALLIGRVDD